MPHPLEHSAADRPLGLPEAEGLAESMRAFGTASRLRLLFELLPGERTVEELATGVSMEPSAVSQQLRVLRQLRFVTATRRGRNVGYRLHDEHVAALLTAIRHHHEHTSASPSALTASALERPGGSAKNAAEA
jgi:ArsR family transcriptional regulator, nickel/cobalt-responsive transcriptional repressor